MSRKVRCAITGEIGTSDTFIKIGTRYYKSQAIYDQYRHEIETRKAIVDLIRFDFLGYHADQKFPSYIHTKLKEYSFYSNDVILKTFEKLSDTIRYYMNNKDFKNDTGKINYIFAILSNNINDVNKEYQWKNNETSHDITTEIPEEEISRPVSGARDISDWLNEEDL